MKLASGYAIVVGALMLLVWVFLLFSGQVPDMETQFLALVFHWAAELVTALALIASGLALWKSKRWAAWGYPLAMGMLIYALINSPGFYVQRQEWGMVAMFALVLPLAIIALVLYVRGSWRHEGIGR